MRLFRGLVCALTSSVALGALSPAIAQETPSATQRGDTAAGDEADIVVTGTLIQRTGYDQPTPVTVLTSDQLQASAPTNIADGLNRLPQFTASNTRGSANIGINNGNFLNLRGLGSNRLLVLLDGERITPTTEAGSVDVNLLPELLIRRVDVVTGGASAAYGSDAVSGVVNYVIDRNFTGLRVVAQNGISSYGDDYHYKLGVAGGAEFADGRGHFVLSLEHFRQDGIESVRDRPWSNQGLTLVGNGTTAAPFRAAENVGRIAIIPGGAIINAANQPVANAAAPLAGLVFTPGGGTRNYVLGQPIPGSPTLEVGGDGARSDFAGLAASLRTDKLYGRLSYELTDQVTAYARVNAARSATSLPVTIGTAGAAAALTIFRDNAYLPASVGSRMDAAGVSSFRLSRLFTEADRVSNDADSDTFDVGVGLDGRFGSWNVHLGYGHGETQVRSSFTNLTVLSNLYAATDAVVNPANGQIVCRVTLTNPGVYPGCVPLNVFGEGAPSQAALDYVFQTSNQRTKSTQDVVTFRANGDLFTLPAGPVSVAIGAEYRRRSLVQTSNPTALSQIQATGIRGLPSFLCPTPTTCRFGGFNTANFGETDANDNIKEAFGEILLPLLNDVPFANRLDVNGALRFTDYSNSGSVTTWKVGVNYSPFNDLRFRATRSRDIRAPNLFDLFAGPTNSFSLALNDAATGRTVSGIVTRTQGNPNLRPERSDTYTIGAVYQPSWLPGLAGSVDYFDINFKDALGVGATPQQILDRCFSGDTVACSQISRDPATGNIQQIVVQQANLNRTIVRGIDFDLSYNREIGPGRLSARAVATRMIDYVETVGGLRTQLVGFDGRAKWNGLLTLSYDTDRFGVYVQERYRGPSEARPTITTALIEDAALGSTFYTDLTLTARFPNFNGVEIYGTVNNLFNAQARPFPSRSGIGEFVRTDGYVDFGRYFTVGARARF